MTFDAKGVLLSCKPQRGGICYIKADSKLKTTLILLEARRVVFLFFAG